MKIFLILLLMAFCFSVSANNGFTPYPFIEDSDATLINIPAIHYQTKAAKVRLKLNFNAETFELIDFSEFDCLQQRYTNFSPYPTQNNYNPCDY